MFGVRPDDPPERVRDEIGGPVPPPTGRPPPRVPSEVLRVQQVQGAAGRRRQVLHARREPRLRAGLAQAAEDVGGGDSGEEGEGRETAQEQGLNEDCDLR